MRWRLTVLFALGWPLISEGQSAGVPSAPAVRGAPDAGTLLKQLLPLMQPATGPASSGLSLEQADGSRTPLPASDPILVQRIRITRNTLFSTEVLLALVAHAEGQSLTLPQMGELAGLITKYYRSHGYPLSRAIIPAQTISSGLLRIEIIEAHFGEIKLDNNSAVRDSVLQAVLSNLKSGQDISQAELDYVLLLLADLPAVKLDARLRPGRLPGTSDLVVAVEPGAATSGSIGVDNTGDSFTGPIRMAGGFNINNPLGLGDTLSASALSSGKGINHARVAYETIVNRYGTRIGSSYSSLRYLLGGTLAPLMVNGTAQESRLFVRQSLRRSTESNVYGQLQYEGLKLRDHIDVSQIKTDRSLQNWTFNLSGDAHDTLANGSNSNSSWSLGLTTGRVTFDDVSAQMANAATAKTEGRFAKWTLNLARIQGFSPSTTLYLRGAGQWTGSNLDSSQKFAPSGLSGVRAYGSGAIAGDLGYLVSAEFGYAIGQVLHGQMQAISFIDSAYVIVNQKPWVTGPNNASLTGAGFGLNWTGPNQWSVRVSMASPLGPKQALISTRATRLWVELRRGY